MGGVVGPTLVTVKSMPMLNGTNSWLLVSLLSTMRLTSSTQARTEWAPATAVQFLLPAGPLLAVSVTLCPTARDCVYVSDQEIVAPSTLKPTPRITPAGDGALP